MNVPDEYINELFEGTNFGPATNGCVKLKRKQLEKTLRDQVGGYWSGHTAYHIAISGGFLIDAKSGGKKMLTLLGRKFMDNQNA